MAYQIDYAYTCHTGKVRTNNEDNFWCCGVRLPVHNQGVDGILAGHTQHWQLPMLAVFDGMGGESCGEMAASAAVEALGGFYEENKKTLKKEPVVFLTEACEYTNSFLSFFPRIGMILNIEEDHLDFFKDLADIERSFHAFADLVPQRGYVIANADDKGARDAVAGLSHPVFTFSLADRTADCYARDVAFFDGCASFDVMIHGELYAHVDLHIPGKHNILNALAAASAAYVLGIPGQAVTLGLEDFHGAGRRFEHKGSYHGAAVYDDYAHHPAELHALLTTARSMGYDRVICAFQPHTYTRTKALFDDFVRELQLPDVTVLAEIYAAREQNVLGISSRDLAEKIPGAIYCSTLDKVADTLAGLSLIHI